MFKVRWEENGDPVEIAKVAGMLARELKGAQMQPVGMDDAGFELYDHAGDRNHRRSAARRRVLYPAIWKRLRG